MSRLFLLLVFLFSPPVFATTPMHIVFGDSLSDEGRLYQATHQAFPPAPFFEGRFSNGPVWSEYLPDQRLNYAFSGAKSDSGNMLSKKLGAVVDNTGLVAQINQYLEQDLNQSDPSRDHYYINIGANDFLEIFEGTGADIERFIPDIVDNIIAGAKRLQDQGAQTIEVFGLPNLGKIPMAQSMTPAQQHFLGLMSAKYNQLLRSQASENGLVYRDVEAFMRVIHKNAKKYGFTNIQDACFDEIRGVVCENPDEYVFWDDKHPSAKVHELFLTLSF